MVLEKYELENGKRHDKVHATEIFYYMHSNNKLFDVKMIYNFAVRVWLWRKMN